ncbi:MAG: PKD domain-containing protein [Saprospiraceae bacterium]|nr:PKD domain-containing protein [Saprospiraceae bacterium]
MANKLLLSLVLSFVALTSFSQTADQTIGCAPLVVTFTPPVGSNTYFWELGVGGATSVEENPTQPYVNPGTYTVNFRQTPNGPILGSVNITVYEKPDLVVAADPMSGCAPLNVAFTNATVINPNITVASWEWVFGDGTSAATQNTSHTYTTAGNYTVSLELLTNYPSCNKTEIFDNLVEVSISPDVNFTTNPNPPSSCTAPLTVNFTNTSETGLMYVWDFGNNTTSTNAVPPAVTYTAEGVYTVTLTGTNALGCSATKSVQVTVGPPLAEFTIPDTVCIGTPVTDIVNSSAGGLYQWTFGPTATPATSTQFQPTVTFNQPGLVTVTLRVTSGACESTTTDTIFVEQLDPGFAFAPQFACDYPFNVQVTPNQTTSVAQYKWVFNRTDSVFTQNATYTVEAESQNPYYIEKDTNLTSIVLQITSEAGCVFRDTNIVKSFSPTAKFEVDVVDGCAPLTVTFRDSSVLQSDIVSWEWHFGDGAVMTTTNTNPLQHVYQNDGDFNAFLVVTNSFGCKDTSYLLPILVGTQLIPDFTVDKTVICPGDSVHFTTLINDPRIDAWHFESDGGRTWHCYQADELNWIFTTEAGDPMDASLTVEYNGCFSTLVKDDLITVKGPIARLDYSMDCATPYDYVFADSSYDATNVTWYFGDGMTSTEHFVTHTYATRDSFQVILEASNPASGCPISRDTATIFVREIIANFMLDTIICNTLPYNLDGSASQDVDARCYRGYTWHFSDGRPITTAEAVTEHFFAGDRDQWLALEVTDINGCRDTLRQDINVFNIFANLGLDDTRICFPGEVNFTDLTDGDVPIVSWEWDFGDANMSNEQNPSHLYTNQPPASSGVISVTLMVEDSVGCPGMATADINYYTPISNIATIPNPNICVGEDISFFATDFTAEGSNLTWTWDFGNGETGAGQTGNATYNQDGQFQVRLFFTEVSTQCADTTTINVNVQDFPQAAFTSSLDNLPPPICYPANANFTNTTISNYPISLLFWNFDNGQTAVGANPSTSFGKGTFDVTLIASTTFGCRDTIVNSYTLVGPEGDFDISATAICVGGEITVSIKDTVDISSFEWNFGDGISVSNMNPVTHTYAPTQTGQIQVVLILKGENDACTAVQSATLSIVEPVAAFDVTDSDKKVCLGDPFVFVNNSQLTNTYTWDFGDGGGTSANAPTYTYNAPGVYTVELLATNTTLGCSDSTTLELNVFVVPQPMVDGAQVCEGDNTVLTIQGSPTSIFVWSPATLLEGGVNLGNTVTTIPLTENATLTITETTIDGCEGTTQLEVVVVPALPELPNDTLATCINAPVLLTVPESEFYTYEWELEPETTTGVLTCNDCTESTLTTPTTVSVYAFPEDIFGLGCVQDTAIFHVVIPEGAIQMPNAFSPNNDQTNDSFNYVTGADDSINEDIIVRTFRVFNRFGQKVYDNDTPQTGWNGEQNDKPAPSDVYIYHVELFLGDCFLGKFTGDVSLIR